MGILVANLEFLAGVIRKTVLFVFCFCFVFVVAVECAKLHEQQLPTGLS